MLEDIRDMLYNELDCIAEEGKMNAGVLDVIDKLTHSIKSIDTIIAMEDADYADGYSRRGGRYDGYAYASGRGMNGGSRGGSSMRNSSRRGSTSRGYSREDGKEKMIDRLEDYMEQTNSDKVKEAIKKVIEQMESE